MTNPLISIVSGTANRLDFLKNMLASVRSQMPDGIPYNFIIVDGGSVDGTETWCLSQPDIHFIQQGELRGAIAAFNEGAKASTAKYVALLNDDIRVMPYSILRGITHLETHPDCGAVAFAENRVAPGYTSDLHVQTISAIDENGEQVAVPYMQTGIVRRWLGELAGFWDIGDPLQHSYGGDVHLSSWIWEHGYTVDEVAGCAIDDQVAPDALREHNYKIEKERGSAYYRVWANGVRINSQPKPVNEDTESLRILLCTLYEPGFGHYKSGLRQAFAKVGLVCDVDYISKPADLLQIAKAWQPQLIFAQMVDPSLMRKLRAVCPSAVAVCWHGDVYREVMLSPAMQEQNKYVDLVLTVNASVVEETVDSNPPIRYWQIGAEPVEPLPTERSHDILFLGNCYSQQRAELGRFLRTQFPGRVGIYGQGWQPQADGHCTYDFARGGALYERCKIAIGDSQFQDDKAFVSNRFFEALYHGAFLLHQYVPELEKWTGFIDGIHYVSWTDLDDLSKLVSYYIEHEDERKQIAVAGQQFVRANYSFEAQVDKLFGLIREL